MKFTVSSNELLSRLLVVGKAIVAKSSLPILENFLFTINNNVLKITASDSEITIETYLNISNCEGNGSYVIPSSKLCEYLRRLPEQPVQFNINPDSNVIEISTNHGIAKQTAYDAAEYPMPKDLSEDGEIKSVILKSDVLLSGVTKTSFATSTDELRPAMLGILMDFADNQVTFVATDSHILSRFIVSNTETSLNGNFILSKKPATLLKSVLNKDENVKIEFTSKRVKFTTDTYAFTSRLIEAVYPAYNNIIPTDNPHEITINRLELLNTISRASLFADGSCLVSFSCTKDNMKVMSQDVNMQCSSQESLSCIYNGPDMTIGFKSTLIIEILSNITTEDVTITLGDPSRAGLISPTVPEENENELMLLMPMMAH